MKRGPCNPVKGATLSALATEFSCFPKSVSGNCVWQRFRGFHRIFNGGSFEFRALWRHHRHCAELEYLRTLIFRILFLVFERPGRHGYAIESMRELIAADVFEQIPWAAASCARVSLLSP